MHKTAFKTSALNVVSIWNGRRSCLHSLILLWWEKNEKCLQILWDSLVTALVDLHLTSYVSWLKRKKQIRPSVNTGYSVFLIPCWLNTLSFLLLWHKLILARAHWIKNAGLCTYCWYDFLMLADLLLEECEGSHSAHRLNWEPSRGTQYGLPMLAALSSEWLGLWLCWKPTSSMV